MALASLIAQPLRIGKEEGIAMLSETNYNALITIKNNDFKYSHYQELLDRDRVEHLLEKGLVHIVAIDRDTFDGFPDPIELLKLTPDGEDAIASFEKEAEQRSRDEESKNTEAKLKDKLARKDARRSWAQLFVNGFIAIAVALLSAYLAENTKVFDWFLKLFH